MNWTAPVMNWTILLPQLALLTTALIVLITGTFSSSGGRGRTVYLALSGNIAFGLLSFFRWGTNSTGFEGMIIMDSFALFMNLVFALSATITMLISISFTRREGIPETEYYTLVLLCELGMSLLASSANLLVLFLGLEIMSLSIYVLTAIVRERTLSHEAAMKYFIMGAFASGFLLYGMAMLFGATGSIDVQAIGMSIKTQSLGHSPLVLLGFCLVLTGLAFKVALVPFHMWIPDVYQGSPTTITGFMTTGIKAAGFAMILRVFTGSFSVLADDWRAIVWVLAVLTMSLGNITALVQNNIKRMLAYSSIAQAGYLAVALVVLSQHACSAILFYLVVYTLMNLGAFAVVIMLERRGEDYLDIKDYRGLATRHPLIALAMSLFMFSLAGIPPTAGFIGKVYIFAEAVRNGYVLLTVIAVLNSVVSVYYYLRVTINMYMKAMENDIPAPQYDALHLLALVITAIGTVWLGIFPAYLLHYALRCFNTGF